MKNVECKYYKICLKFSLFLSSFYIYIYIYIYTHKVKYCIMLRVLWVYFTPAVRCSVSEIEITRIVVIYKVLFRKMSEWSPQRSDKMAHCHVSMTFLLSCCSYLTFTPGIKGSEGRPRQLLLPSVVQPMGTVSCGQQQSS
jgi:hypothetical protein